MPFQNIKSISSCANKTVLFFKIMFCANKIASLFLGVIILRMRIHEHTTFGWEYNCAQKVKNKIPNLIVVISKYQIEFVGFINLDVTFGSLRYHCVLTNASSRVKILCNLSRSLALLSFDYRHDVNEFKFDRIWSDF